jgi:hypothetical protein
MMSRAQFAGTSIDSKSGMVEGKHYDVCRRKGP